MDKNRENPVKLPYFLTLYHTFKDLPHGTIITYSQIDEITHIEDFYLAKKGEIRKFKDIMLHRSNKALENIRNTGYMIVKPGDHCRLASKQFNRAKRSIHRSAEYLTFVDYDKLTDIEKHIHISMLSKLKIINSIMTNELEENMDNQIILTTSIPKPTLTP